MNEKIEQMKFELAAAELLVEQLTKEIADEVQQVRNAQYPIGIINCRWVSDYEIENDEGYYFFVDNNECLISNNDDGIPIEVARALIKKWDDDHKVSK